MSELTIMAYIVGYFIVGAIVGGIMVSVSDNPDGLGLIVVFWPLFVACLIIMLFFMVPYKIGRWIGDRFY